MYNEGLVKVGEYMLDMDWVESWDEELALMNAGKVGAQYKFPKSLIELQSVWHARKLKTGKPSFLSARDLKITKTHSTNYPTE